MYNLTVYRYRLGSRTTAFFLAEDASIAFSLRGFGQQVSIRVKQNCCCPIRQSITVFWFTPLFYSKFFHSLFHLMSLISSSVKSDNLEDDSRHCDVNITRLIEPTKKNKAIGQQFEFLNKTGEH